MEKNHEQAPIGPEELRKFTRVLQSYKAGKQATEQRVVEAERWWRLRSAPRSGEGFHSVSGWLHHVIVSKHADVVDSYPEPTILPREPSDKPEARALSRIIPCILEQNRFEQTYSDAAWQKLKTGTGVYKIVWDSGKCGGMGDIGIQRVDLLNVFWEPGVTDIQKSRFFFHTEPVDRDLLRQKYPQLRGGLRDGGFVSTRFCYDRGAEDDHKAAVIECYYHKETEGRQILHYVKYVEDTVLFATENEPEYADRGLYDHGKYPFVFDVLFPVEGSPCGYGYVDLCKNPQTEIDLLKTAILKNAMVGAAPRYFARQDGNVNEEEFLDLSRPLVHVEGNLGQESLRPIDYAPLDRAYVDVLDRTIEELRQTSGTTETSTGNISAGVTAAAAIRALQEASGKGSRDSNLAAYRAYGELVEFVIELIRQFYDLPRQFRILGPMGTEEFLSYSNAALAPQHQGTAWGVDMGCRLPVFDIRVLPQKRSVYTQNARNELALELFRLGFFAPGAREQALLALSIMDFDGKNEIMQCVAAGTSPEAPGPGTSAAGQELPAPARPGEGGVENDPGGI